MNKKCIDFLEQTEQRLDNEKKNLKLRIKYKILRLYGSYWMDKADYQYFIKSLSDVPII